MIVVSNTSPIINLACVSQLDLLRQLYGQIIIPQAVFTEIAIAGAGEPGAKEVQGFDWITPRSVTHWVLPTSLCSLADSSRNL